jgi:hypothetical protein
LLLSCKQALCSAAVAFYLSSRRFSRSLPSLLGKDAPLAPTPHPAVHQAAATSRRALFCAAFVVFSVVFRALFAVPFAFASAAERAPLAGVTCDLRVTCDLLLLAACPLSCAACQSVWYLVYEWIKDNPHIRVVFLIVR